MYHWLIVYHNNAWTIDFGSWERDDVEQGYVEAKGIYSHVALVTTEDDGEEDIAMLCTIKPKPSNKRNLLTMH